MGYIVDVDGGFVTEVNMSTSFCKHDYASGSSDVACSTPNLLFGKMSFLINSGAVAEDDSVLMGLGYHRGRNEG